MQKSYLCQNNTFSICGLFPVGCSTKNLQCPVSKTCEVAQIIFEILWRLQPQHTRDIKIMMPNRLHYRSMNSQGWLIDGASIKGKDQLKCFGGRWEEDKNGSETNLTLAFLLGRNKSVTQEFSFRTKWIGTIVKPSARVNPLDLWQCSFQSSQPPRPLPSGVVDQHIWRARG